MITATEHGLETAQRVRQFFVKQQLEDLGEPASGESDSAEEPERHEEDLPAFLRNRSLRRRLDHAFNACYQSTMGDWFRALFRRA